MGITFFFDTYALIELLRGSPSYLSATQGASIVTTKLNLMELHFVILRNHGKDNADTAYDAFVEYAIPLSDDTFKEANQLKLQLNKRDVSYIDCVGYVLARSQGAKFLTGDNAFKDLENVEFVK